MRRTKIIATIGPSSASEEVLVNLLKAGVNVFRFNMKHNDVSWHSEKIELIESILHKMKMRAGVLLDLQGPEIRIRGLETPLVVERGQLITISGSGNDGIPLDKEDVFSQGQKMFFDDGLLEFEIVEVNTRQAIARVIEGGVVKDRKTVNFPGASLDFPTLIERDLEHLSLAARHDVDYIALSFVRSAQNIRELKHEMKQKKINARIIAKIEHPLAVQNLDSIINESDGIMVARGDLGIEYPLEEVPSLQKLMVRRAREEGKLVIIATQMLESMSKSSRPTRAEVSDVANAVYDSADAVMLSGETASGNYPVRSVEIMARIAQKVDESTVSPAIQIDWKKGSDENLLIGSAYELVRFSGEKSKIAAFIVLSESTQIVQLLSRLRPTVPIIAATHKQFIADQLSLTWGVLSVKLPDTIASTTNGALEYLTTNSEVAHMLKKGEKIVILTSTSPKTSLNTVRLMTL
jgi:pyruvate kinase